MPERGEGIHPQMMVHRGGISNSFSAAFVEEMSIVIMRVDGKLNIEYHYKEGFPEVIYQKSGPWVIPNDGANWCIHQYPYHACNSATDQENALTPAPGAPSPQVTFKYAQDTAVDTQNTSLGARETPPDVQVTPPDEQETLPDTHSNSQDT
jgi:hypothetical protein